MSTAHAPGRAADRATRPIRILHLEDSPLDAELIEESLLDGGLAFEVHRVETRDAFTAALEGGAYDVILADYVLPSFDGLTALTIAHAARPEVPFVFVSGTIVEDTATEALKRGATDYVVKGRLQRLPATVRRALAEAGEIAERRRAEEALRELNATLEQRIAQRTAELEEANARLRAEIEERRQVEAALQESTTRLHAIIDHSPEGIFVLQVGPDGRLVYERGNPVIQALAGLRDREMQGRDPREVLPTSLMSGIEAVAAGCIESGRPAEFETNLSTEEGLRIRETILVPVRVAGGRVAQLIGSSRDVTQRREAEERLRQMQKMEAVGQLTSGVAHDFNNLLTVVSGNLEVIERSLDKNPDRARRAVTLAQLGAERAATVTQRLLSFARREPLDPRRVNAVQILEGMRDLLRQTVTERITIEFHLARDLWPVEIDASDLENAVLNLAANARDAIPGQGRLTITAANAPRKDGDPSGRDRVMISVADDGAGMPKEVLARVTEPFFTTKDAGKGTGLGLSQVYGFAEQSGGGLEITSEVGRGTRVNILLPRAAPTPEDSRVPGRVAVEAG